jgi:glyoxylase-like metal-dependent hydrolase (beta-lactamase superfamily II)
MDKISISDKNVIPLDNVAHDVTGLRIAMVNVFAVLASGGWVLVDTGLPLSADRIKRWAASQFGDDAMPRCILLTHGHFDHVGAAKDLATTWNVPVYVHAQEMGYVTGAKQYPPPDPAAGGGVMSVLSPLYPRDPIDLTGQVRELPTDGSVPCLPGWRWIHTPGHTEGHVSFYREEGRTLLVGDAFCTTKAESAFAVATQRPELHGPPAYFTMDWDQARDSVRDLARLQPTTVAPGHGMPVSGDDVPSLLDELAANFDEIARPKRGQNAA